MFNIIIITIIYIYIYIYLFKYLLIFDNNYNYKLYSNFIIIDSQNISVFKKFRILSQYR